MRIKQKRSVIWLFSCFFSFFFFWNFSLYSFFISNIISARFANYCQMKSLKTDYDCWAAMNDSLARNIQLIETINQSKQIYPNRFFKLSRRPFCFSHWLVPVLAFFFHTNLDLHNLGSLLFHSFHNFSNSQY